MKSILFLCIFLTCTYLVPAQNNTDCDRNFYSAYSLLRQKKHAEALPYFEKVLACSTVCNNYYNAARVESVVGNTEQGFIYLKKAIDLGYGDISALEKEIDFSNMKSKKDWSKINSWVDAVKNRITTEIAKINIGCPASNAIPYKINGKWGYLEKSSLKKITLPIFDKVSFVGLTGLAEIGQYDISFDCSGKITELSMFKIQKDRYLDGGQIGQPGISTELKKGFVIRNNNFYSYSPIYQDFKGIKLYDSTYLAIVKQNNTYSLIKNTGEVINDLKNYPYLLFYNYGKDYHSDLNAYSDRYGDFTIFFKDATGAFGYLDQNFNKIIIATITTLDEPHGINEDQYTSDIRTYIELSDGIYWGIWDCSKKQWICKPEYNEIVYYNRSFSGDYSLFDCGKTIDMYFLVKKDNKEFYIDIYNKKYIPKE